MVFAITFIAVLALKVGAYVLVKRARAARTTYASRLAPLRNRTPKSRPTIAHNKIGVN